MQIHIGSCDGDVKKENSDEFPVKKIIPGSVKPELSPEKAYPSPFAGMQTRALKRDKKVFKIGHEASSH